MSKVLMITALVACTAPFAGAKSIAGDWQGTLSTPNGDLRLVLHITESGDGSLKATLDSVDQNANGIPVTTVTFKDSKLSLDVEAVHGTYEGTVNRTQRRSQEPGRRDNRFLSISSAALLRRRPSTSPPSPRISTAPGRARLTRAGRNSVWSSTSPTQPTASRQLWIALTKAPLGFP